MILQRIASRVCTLLHYDLWNVSKRSISHASNWIVFNMKDRVEAMRTELKPPVGNKMLHNNDLQIMFVGGPNDRKDFHLECGQVIIIGTCIPCFPLKFCNNSWEHVGALHSIGRRYGFGNHRKEYTEDGKN